MWTWIGLGFLAGIGSIALAAAFRMRHERRQDQRYCLKQARREIEHTAITAWETSEHHS